MNTHAIVSFTGPVRGTDELLVKTIKEAAALVAEAGENGCRARVTGRFSERSRFRLYVNEIIAGREKTRTEDFENAEDALKAAKRELVDPHPEGLYCDTELVEIAELPTRGSDQAFTIFSQSC